MKQLAYEFDQNEPSLRTISWVILPKRCQYNKNVDTYAIPRLYSLVGYLHTWWPEKPTYIVYYRVILWQNFINPSYILNVLGGNI